MGEVLIDVTVIFNSQAFINTLYNTTLRKIAIRSLRRGIGSMDYIQSLLIMEDDLDENMGVFDDGEAGKVEDTEQQDVAEASAVATTYQHSTVVCVQIVDPCPKKWRISVVNRKIA